MEKEKIIKNVIENIFHALGAVYYLIKIIALCI